MKYRLKVIVLAAGAILGFASGIHSLRHHHHCHGDSADVRTEKQASQTAP